MTDPTGRPAGAEPVVPDPEQATPSAPDGWAGGTEATARSGPGAGADATDRSAADPASPPEAAADDASARSAAEPSSPPAAADATEPSAAPKRTGAPSTEGGDAIDRPAADPPVTPAGDTTTDDRRRRKLLAACAALFVVSVVLAVLAAVLASRLESERNRRDAVEEVAGRFATALLTYNHESLDQAKERVLSLSTGKFRREYEQAFANGLDALIRETRATSAGTVTDIFVGPVEDDTASAIVVANAVSEGTTGTRRTVASYIQLELVRVSGQWRVDGVTNLNFGQGTTPTSTPE